MAIEMAIIEEAVEACSKNDYHAADEAAIASYIAEKYGTEDWDEDVLNTDLTYFLTDSHFAFLDQDESARYFIPARGQSRGK